MKNVKKLTNAQLSTYLANTKRAKEDKNNLKAKEVIMNMLRRSESLGRIARSLNMVGYTTSRGSKFHAASVRRVIDLYGLASDEVKKRNVKIKAKYEKACTDLP